MLAVSLTFALSIILNDKTLCLVTFCFSKFVHRDQYLFSRSTSTYSHLKHFVLEWASIYRVRQKETGLYCGVLVDTDYPLDFLIAQTTVIFLCMVEGLKLNSLI